MARRAQVWCVPMAGPDDISGIARLISEGTLDPGTLVAILGKTEGNGCVNDFTRGYAVQSLRLLLSPHLGPDALARLPLVMSGGTEGGLSPHWTLFAVAQAPADPDAPPALALASRITRPLTPQEIGRPAQAALVRDAVRAAMAEAGIAGPDDVHYVQVKCPLLTAERVAAADGDTATDSMLRSMGLSRGAAALGVALALGEIQELPEGAIGRDLTLWSGRASCSAGIELMACEIVVMGNAPGWVGPLRIGHRVMDDAIDAVSVVELLAEATGTPTLTFSAAPPPIMAVLAKAEASSQGHIRGQRHTMLEDSDISATRHARGFVAGVLAGLLGRTDLFVSGGAEHQGPDGGGPVAIIYDQGATP